MSSTLNPIIAALRDIRREQGLTQVEVARRAKVSLSTIRHAERNRCTVTLDLLTRWASALGYALELCWTGVDPS